MKKRIASILLAVTMTISSFYSFATGWHEDQHGWWYETDSSGSYYAGCMATINGKQYVFDDYGYAFTNQWVEFDDGTWSYCTGSGAVAKNCWIGDYYVDNNGEMLTNTYTPDGYYVGADGKWTDPAVAAIKAQEEALKAQQEAAIKAQEEALKAQQEAAKTQANSSSSNLSAKTYTKEEIFAMADPYVANIPGAKRSYVVDLGIGATAFYTTNNGRYKVEFTRDLSPVYFGGGTMEYIVTEAGYTK